jgi:hypothetical protein
MSAGKAYRAFLQSDEVGPYVVVQDYHKFISDKLDSRNIVYKSFDRLSPGWCDTTVNEELRMCGITSYFERAREPPVDLYGLPETVNQLIRQYAADIHYVRGYKRRRRSARIPQEPVSVW